MRLRGIARRGRSRVSFRVARRRIRRDYAELHFGHHQPPKGRRLKPSRRLSERARRCRTRPDDDASGFSLDAADVPCERLVLSMDRDAARRYAYLLARVEPANIFRALVEHRVTHFCGAPVVLNMLINSRESDRRPLPGRLICVTAGSAPPAAVLAAMEQMGFEVIHGYGLTETFGAVVVSQWHEEWDGRELPVRARLKARQGVTTVVEAGADVFDPATDTPVPLDGTTVGEIVLRGNVMMKGYLKNPEATAEAFRSGWFHTGDLGVMHPDGYLEVTDRAKDIVISGGENISSLEVEGVLFTHPAVLEAAVVARPEPKWGETPCAFVALKPGANAGADELIAFCRARLAGFKVPHTIVFGELPKTATGKVQKFILRERARQLATGSAKDAGE